MYHVRVSAHLARLIPFVFVLGLLTATGSFSKPAEAGATYALWSQGTVIMGQSGDTLKVTAERVGGDLVARQCYDIDSNTFYVSVVPMTIPLAGDICSGTTSDAAVENGDYLITAGVYPPGAQQPEREVQLQLTVNGFLRYATVDGSALSAVPLGDANCDGLLDGQDLSDALHGAAGFGPSAACLDAANVVCGDPISAADVLAIAKQMAGLFVDLGACPAFLNAPTPISPPDGAVFDQSPRTTTVQWGSVAGAAEYAVYLDAESCEPYGDWCSNLGWGVASEHLTGTSTTVSPSGAGLARWRVAAIGADGRPGPFSEWREFEHLQ